MPENNGDAHAHIRYFKLLEVAYNLAKNGYYERSAEIASHAMAHYDETDIEDNADQE